MKIYPLIWVALSLQDLKVSGHGILWKPVSRTSAWKAGFNTPAYYDHTGVQCGGSPRFDKVIPRTCNICGGRPGTSTFVSDSFATGTITGTYKSGGTIKLEYQATANHMGYFLVKLCVNNQPKAAPPQSCFDRMILKTINNEDSYPMARGKKWFKWEVKIPNGVTCNHCMLQVDWKTGNNGVPCLSLKQCAGLRTSEHFVTCSDIRIKGNSNDETGSVTCPKTHKYAYKHGEWCCQTNKDCDNNQLKLTSACCQYSAYKECQGRKSGKRCKNHESVTTSNGECKDTGKHCKYWKGKGFCNGSHEQFMTKYCPKSCNKC